MLVALAIMAATQWVASAGGSLSVRATTRSATSGPSGVDARWPCLVAQQTVVALLGEALLPAPDAGLRLAGPAHDPIGADAISAVQYDLGDVERLQTTTVGRAQDDADSWAHEPDWPGRRGRCRAPPPCPGAWCRSSGWPGTEPDVRALPHPVPRVPGSLRDVYAPDPQAPRTTALLAPIWLSAAVTLTRVTELRVSPACPVSGSDHAMPPFPRPGPDGHGSPSSAVL